MALERTLSIIKPDAVRKQAIGRIVARIEAIGLRIVAARMLHLSRDAAGSFYEVHRERDFYRDLVEFMISGPVMLLVLEGQEAIARYRQLMGATDPARAVAGTLRAEFAESVEANAVHGSDAADTAAREIAFFFSSMDIHARH